MHTCFALLILLLPSLAIALIVKARHGTGSGQVRRRSRCPECETHSSLAQPKPPWIRDEILRLKALMPLHGCRKIAATFNHMYLHRQISVGKSFVANVLKAEGHRLLEVRREIRRRKPRPMPKNVLWALDLTFVSAPGGNRPVLGLVDHGTRACLALRALPSKGAIVILRILLDIIEQFGKPRTLRTDNEAIFTSKIFRLCLMILGIRHQRTAPFAPWQNGRIERFFRTLKQMLRHTTGLSGKAQEDLNLFRIWYNHVRPHQNLDGFTPAQM